MKSKTTGDGIFILESGQPGPTLAIFAGVHGDETAGVEALKAVKDKLRLKRGKLYLVLANSPAIAKGVRQVGQNLNRLFKPGVKGDSYEAKRARQLMSILDDCEALLDLHGFVDKKCPPFIITEPNALDLVSKFEPAIISTNWTASEPGATDGYMYERGKIGVCFECGPISQLAAGKRLALKTVLQFLKYYDMIETDVAYSQTKQRVVRAERAVIRTSPDYHLEPGLFSFHKLRQGQVYGSQAGQPFIGKSGEYIIFPHYDPPIDSEAFIIGRVISYGESDGT